MYHHAVHSTLTAHFALKKMTNLEFSYRHVGCFQCSFPELEPLTKTCHGLEAMHYFTRNFCRDVISKQHFFFLCSFWFCTMYIAVKLINIIAKGYGERHHLATETTEKILLSSDIMCYRSWGEIGYIARFLKSKVRNNAFY